MAKQPTLVWDDAPSSTPTKPVKLIFDDEFKPASSTVPSKPPSAPAPAKRLGKTRTVSWLGESNLPVVGQYKHPGGSQVSDVISYPAPTKENPGARVFLVPPSAKRKPSSPRDANILNAPTAQTPDFAPMVVEQGPDGSFVRRGSYRPAAAPAQQAAPAQSPAPEQPRIADLMRNRETVEQWKSRRPKEVAELERDYTTYAELKDRNPMLALQFQQSAEEKYAKLQAELGSPDQFISQQRQVEMGMLTPPQLAMQGADGRTASIQSLRGSDMQGAQASQFGAGVGEQAAQYDDAAARVAYQRGFAPDNAAGRVLQSFGTGAEIVAAGAARLLPEELVDNATLDEVSRNQTALAQAAADKSGGVGRAMQGIAQSYGVVAPGAALGAVTGGAATGMALTAGLSQYGQAYQQATDAGLRGADREKFATVNAAAESLMSLAFTKLLKMPGLEGAFVKAGIGAETAKGVLYKAAKAVGMSGLEELPEEVLTQIAQNVNARLSGVDAAKKVLTGDELFDIAVQSMGAAGGARALGIAPSIPGEISKANVIRGNAKAYVETPTGPADWAKSHPMAAEEIAAVVQEGKPVSRAMMEANSLPTMDSVKRSKWAADVHAAVVDLKAKSAVNEAADEIAAQENAAADAKDAEEAAKKPLKSMKKKPVAASTEEMRQALDESSRVFNEQYADQIAEINAEDAKAPASSIEDLAKSTTQDEFVARAPKASGEGIPVTFEKLLSYTKHEPTGEYSGPEGGVQREVSAPAKFKADGLAVVRVEDRYIGRLKDDSGKLVTYRDSEGNAVGILSVTFGEDGKPASLEVAVEPSWRGRGIASLLYSRAEQMFPGVENATGLGGYTEDGARFAHSRLSKKIKADAAARPDTARAKGETTNADLFIERNLDREYGDTSESELDKMEVDYIRDTGESARDWNGEGDRLPYTNEFKQWLEQKLTGSPTDASQPNLAELTSPEQPAPAAQPQAEVPPTQQAEVGNAKQGSSVEAKPTNAASRANVDSFIKDAYSDGPRGDGGAGPRLRRLFDLEQEYRNETGNAPTDTNARGGYSEKFKNWLEYHLEPTNATDTQQAEVGEPAPAPQSGVASIPPMEGGDDATRYTNFTSDRAASAVLAGEPFRYSRGMLESTADPHSDDSQVADTINNAKYGGTFDRSPFGNKVIILDLPFSEMRKHRSVANATGEVDNKYVVGVYDRSTGVFTKNPGATKANPANNPAKAASPALTQGQQIRVISRAYPGTEIKPVAGEQGRYTVTLPNGKFLTVLYTPEVVEGPANRERLRQSLEARSGRPVTEAELDNATVTGFWRVSDGKGFETDGQGLVRILDSLGEGQATATALHEARHSLVSMGLMTEAEFDALAMEAARKSGQKPKTIADAEEMIAALAEKGDLGARGFIQTIRDIINRFMAAITGDKWKPNAQTATKRIQSGKVLRRAGKTESRREAAGRLSAEVSGDVRYSAEMNNPLQVESVDLSKFGWREQDDNYIYHVTSKPNADKIAKSGFSRGKSMFTAGSYPAYSKGKTFFTDRSGVKYWEDRVEQQLFHSHDDPPDVAVVRIPKSLVADMLQDDKTGTDDAKHNAYYIDTNKLTAAQKKAAGGGATDAEVRKEYENRNAEVGGDVRYSADGRPYSNAPDSLMGIAKNPMRQKQFDETKYKYEQWVRATFPDGTSHVDAVKGLNKSHALERARRNWDGAQIEAIDKPSDAEVGGDARYSAELNSESLKYFTDSAIEKAVGEEGYKSRNKVVIMPIDDFLSLADQIPDGDTGKPEAEDAASKGIKWSSVPRLLMETSRNGASKAIGHEGRHRALSLKKRGIDEMPVIVTDSLIRFENQKPGEFDRVENWPSFVMSEDGKRKHKYPISRAEDGSVSSIYGDGARYSHETVAEKESPRQEKKSAVAEPVGGKKNPVMPGLLDMLGGDGGDVRYSAATDPSQAKKERVASLANPGMSPDVRNQIDAERLQMDAPETQPLAEVQRLADAITPDQVRAALASGKPITAPEMEAARRLKESVTRNALVNRTAANLAESAKVIAQYDLIGTESARAFNIRRDRVETPFQRNQRLLGDELIGAPKSIRDAIKDALRLANEALLKGDKKTAKVERDRATKLSREGARMAEKNRAFLERIGLLPKDGDEAAWNEIFGNDIKSFRLLREASALNQGYGSAIMEYWNSLLLSGPATQARNLLGTPLNYSIEAFIERPILAAARVAIGKQSASDTLRAASEWWKGFSLAGAWRHAADSYRQETSTFDRLFKDEDYGGLLENMDGYYSIRGLKGRVIRGLGWGPLRAADQFWKALIGGMEVGRFAYAQARSELGANAKSEDISNRMAEIMADYQSDAWEKASARSDIATFTEKGSETRHQVKQRVKALRNVVPGAKFIIPFIDTPVNIAAQTIERAPALGAIRYLFKMRDNIKNKRPTFDGLGEAAVKQLVSTAALTALLQSGLLSDDDDKYFAIRSGQHADPLKRYTFKWGDTDLSYQGLEPVASLLSLMADWNASRRSGVNPGTVIVGSTIDQIANKPMLQGLGDILQIMNPRDYGTADSKWKTMEANGLNYAKNFGASWVPAIYKQTVKALRPNAVNTRIMATDAEGKDKWTLAGKRMVEQAEIGWMLEKAGFKDPPAAQIDVFGKQKSNVILDGQSWWSNPGTDFLYRLTSPLRTTEQNAHPANELLAAWNRTKPEGAEDYKLSAVEPRYTDSKGKPSVMDEHQFEQLQRLAGGIADKLYAKGKFDPKNPTESQVAMLTERLLPAAKEEARRLVVDSIVTGKPVTETIDQIAERVEKKVRVSVFNAASEKVKRTMNKGEVDWQRDRRVEKSLKKRDVAREQREKLRE